ncbi:MAG: protein-L-isoaspartate(D-aspartate) O-methyltransferase [Halieaceae bacterium]
MFRWGKYGAHLCLALAFAAASAQASAADDFYGEARMDMLESIRESVRETAAYTGKHSLSERVMVQMGQVPRQEFVLPEMQSRAYLNTALPISHGQTISQPLIVALMTDFLDTEPGDVILEVGTGSGYQAAVLSALVSHVYSIEIIAGLTETAREVLGRLGYDNVTLKTGDGYLGWPQHAPFDGIVVTAAADEVPAPLVQQLKPGGRLVIPVEFAGGAQELLVIEKNADGSTNERSVLPVRFVPLTGER